MSTPFVDFGRKTQYSVKNGMGDTKTALPLLKERGQHWFAVSDYGECSGWIGQYFTCIKNGIVPVLGMEAFVNDYRFSEVDGETVVRRMDENGIGDLKASEMSDDELDWSQIDFPIDLFAKTIEGYFGIIRIHNDAQINGIGKRPRTSDAFLKENGRGIVALLPTPYSEVSSCIFNGDFSRAKSKYEFYRSVFDRVYVEIPILEDESLREVNEKTVRWCVKNDIPMIPVINSHYDAQEDFEAFEIFKRCGEIRGGFSYEVDYAPGMYMKSLEEVWDTFHRYHEGGAFTEDVFRDMLILLDGLCNVFKTLELDTSPKTPHFPNCQEELKDHARKGLVKYGFDKKPNAEAYRERLEYELDNICRAGFADYFILIERMFDWHINKMHRLGSTGRGSASGSLVLRCLGVTKIDPIEHGLLFERFLDASRLDEIINKGGKLSGADFPDVDCFAEGTLVLSEGGVSEIMGIQVGDRVYGDDGLLHRVERIADYENAEVLRVCYGKWFFDCTPHHRLLVASPSGDRLYKMACELRRGDALVESDKSVIPVVEVCNGRIASRIRDLKVEDAHCYRVCGRAYSKVTYDDGGEDYCSETEVERLVSQMH